VVIVFHLALLSQSAPLTGVLRLAPFNLAAAGLVIAAGAVDGAPRYVLWLVAVALLVITPYLGVATRFDLSAPHFVERHGLLLIVALGESVVAIGAAVDSEHITAGTVAVVVLALALPAALWWAFFAGDERAAERALEAVSPAERGILAIRGYFFAFIPMLLGIVAAAAGIHEAIAHPDEPLSDGAAIALAVGIAVFFAGDVVYRRELRAGPLAPPAAIAVLALPSIPLGTAVSAQTQLIALVAVVAAALTIEHRRSPAAPAATDEV
jgi:low temperature requirement protein LtrA